MSRVSRGPALAPLRETPFRWYFAARAVNLAGSTMASVGLAFAVLEVSDSPTALGTVLAAFSTPMVLFLLAGGVVADRIGPTRTIQAGNLASGVSQLASAALLLTGSAELWHLAALAAVNGTAAALCLPALASVLPRLVPREQLQQANVLVSMTRSALTVVGPSLAALLVVTAGPGWALAADGTTYLLSAALMSRVRLPRPAHDGAGAGVLHELREGWRFVRATSWFVVVVLAFCLIVALHQGGMYTLGPVLATRTDIGAEGWGLILSAEALGLVLTGLVLLRVRLERPLLLGMLGTAAYGAPLVALGLRPELVTVLLCAFVAGAAIEVFGLGWNLAMQEQVPPAMLSRAYSFDALGSFLAIPLGQLAAGPLAAAFGLRPVVLAAGLGIAVVALLTLLSPAVRRLPRAPAHPGPGGTGVGGPVAAAGGTA